MKKSVVFLTLVLTISFFGYSQNVGIGTTTPHSSAALEIKNTSKGVLLPTMTAAQRNAIASPAKGLMVYDTTNNAHYYYTGNQWKPVGSSLLKTDSSLNIGKQVKPIKDYNISGSNQQVYDTTGYLYDDGGPTGNYSNFAFHSIILATFEALAIIIELQELETEGPYDSLRIIANGITRTYWGSQTDTILIDNPSPYVEIRFNSNNVNNLGGFKLHWKKILIAGNATTGYDSTQRSGWYYNEVKQYMRGGINALNNWHPDSSGIGSFSFGDGTSAKGISSFSAGTNSQATGNYSVALGYATKALRFGSFAMGNSTTASRDFSTAMGLSTTASGERSTAMGDRTTALHTAATAMGSRTTASGGISTAMGLQTTALGYVSTAMGISTTASGSYATAMGNGTRASGESSTAAGVFTQSKFYGGTVIGMYNDSTNAPNWSSINSFNRIFQIGNGTANDERSNAMTVLLNGNVGIGVLNPDQQLSIAKGMNIDENDANNGTVSNSIRFGSSGSEAIGSKRTAGGNQNGLDFYSNNIRRMSITNNGNVGIGTSSPSQLLSVAAGMNIDQNNVNTGTVDNSLRFGSNSGEAIASKRTVGGNQHGLDFYTANTNRLSIANNGNVGIGTSSPSQLLSVAAGMNIDQNNANTGTVDNSLRFGNNSGEAIASKRTSGGNQFGLDFYTNNINRISVKQNGNVGIGITDPSERMDVTGNGKFSGNIVVQSNKGIIRNTTSTQLKQVVTNVSINGPSIGGFGTHTQSITWSEAFSASPIAAYVGNATSGGGWAEVVVTLASVSSTGCTIYIFNPRNFTVNPTFSINLVATGAQ